MLNGTIKVGVRHLDGAKGVGYYASKVVRTPINNEKNAEWNLRINKLDTLEELITIVGLLGSLDEVATLGATIKKKTKITVRIR